MDRQELQKYLKHLEEGKKQWVGIWDIVYRFTLPERAYLYAQDGSPPSYKNVYDSTAINAAERLTNLIISGLCPPWQQWFKLSPGAKITTDRRRTEVRKITETIEKKIFILLNQSNFYQEFQPFILDRVVGGTGALGAQARTENIDFYCVPLSEIALADDDNGSIVAISRRYKMPFFIAQRQYPKISSASSYEALKESPMEKVELILFSVRGQFNDWETRIYLDKDFHELAHFTDLHPPIIASRWSKVPGSPYGRGPAIRSMSDIRALNRLKELSLKNAARASLGVYTVADDGIVNPYTLTLDEGSFIPVGSNETQAPTIAPLPTAGDFDVSMMSIDRLQMEIKNSFIADQFGPTDKTPMSATEVAERTRVVAQELGMTIGRLEHEVLVPLLKRYLTFLQATDPEVPEELRLDGDIIDVEFTSRLAQSQWAMEDQELSQYLAEVAQHAQMDQKLMFLVNSTEAFRYKAELKGIPARLLNNDKQIEQQMQAMQEQMQQQQAMEGEDVGRR